MPTLLITLLDVLAVPLLFLALCMIYRIAKLTNNRKFFLCFGTFFGIGIVRRLLAIVGPFDGYEVDYVLLYVNAILMLIGFYFIWKNIERLIGGLRPHGD